MQIENKYTLLTSRGTTSDIIRAVMMAYDTESDYQISQLANQLRGSNDRDSCRNIFNYLLDNVQYRADEGKQEVRTPARLIHDGVGDCKSYSIFTATILRYLRIPHFFRFVSYDNRKEATHVYVVALIDKSEIPIDVVACIQAHIPFGSEKQYTYRVDMKDRTTRIAYLSGLGDGAMIGNAGATVAQLPSDKIELWLDSENESTLTLAKGYLLSEWNKNWTIYAVARTVERQLEILNELQYIAVMIALYNKYHADNEMIYRLGCAMAYLISTGAFDSDTADASSRDFFSEQNILLAEQTITDSDILPYFDDFMAVWNTNVVEANHRYVDESGQTVSIGAVNDTRKSFYNMGGGYLYSYMSKNESDAISLQVAQKRNTQIDLAGWFSRNANSALLPAEQSNLIYSGCSSTWGGEPRVVLSELKAGKAGITGTPSVGWVATATAIVTAVVSIIKGLISIFKKKDPAPTDAAINGGYPDPQKDGFPISGSGGSGLLGQDGLISKSSVWMLPMIALAGGLLIKKMKNK